MNAIEISNISKTYTVKGNAVDAVKNLSLSVDRGEVFGFLGPNGAGKSTTIKILVGLIRPTSGKVGVMGHDANDYSSRMRVGYLPENPAFFDYLTAVEYLTFVGRTFNMHQSLLRDKVAQILKILDLWDARQRPIRGYSKGMVQRLGLAQALIHDPDVYILDEPMSGLDPIGRALVKDIILDLRSRGKCVFFSTHITSDVETVSDRVGILLRGTLHSVERVESIMTEGVTGYSIRVRAPGATSHREQFVQKNDLSRLIAEITAGGGEIVLIEPKRKNLEAFFLDIVKRKDA